MSALDRLRALPEVFDLVRLEFELGVSAGIARTMASRWARRGLVERFSAGLYINRVTRPQSVNTMDEIDPMYWAALILLFPSAIVVGAGPLRAGNLSTQLNRKETVAIWAGRSKSDYLRDVPSVFEPKKRSMYWYRKVGRWTDRGVYPIPSLKPEAALADALLYDAGWRPDRDDIDLEPAQEIVFERAWRELKRQRDSAAVSASFSPG